MARPINTPTNAALSQDGPNIRNCPVLRLIWRGQKRFNMCRTSLEAQLISCIILLFLLRSSGKIDTGTIPATISTSVKLAFFWSWRRLWVTIA